MSDPTDTFGKAGLEQGSDTPGISDADYYCGL
jgi:hypothetical protein